MSRRFQGLISAVFTPMREDGSVDLERIPRMAERLLAEGVAGLLVCGSTGEGPSLTGDERKAVAEAYIAAAAGRVPVMVHAGHNSLREASGLAEHAHCSGADAILAAPPSYFRPGSLEALADCCAEIAAGAPDLPFYYYHIPRATGVRFAMADFLRVCGERFPRLAGVKFTDEHLADFQLCVQLEAGRYQMLYGRDESLLSGLVAGAAAATGSTYNYAAPLFQKVWKAFDRGDLAEARQWQVKAAEIARLLEGYGGPIAGGKAVMKLAGIDCGPARLPLESIGAEQLKQLEHKLTRMGFFEWARKQ